MMMSYGMTHTFSVIGDAAWCNDRILQQVKTNLVAKIIGHFSPLSSVVHLGKKGLNFGSSFGACNFCLLNFIISMSRSFFRLLSSNLLSARFIVCRRFWNGFRDSSFVKVNEMEEIVFKVNLLFDSLFFRRLPPTLFGKANGLGNLFAKVFTLLGCVTLCLNGSQS